MTESEIREKFYKDKIADKATATAREKAGGEAAFLASGIQSVLNSTMEEVYLMGWRDAIKSAESSPSDGTMKHTPDGREIGQIDRDAIENAKDINKLDIAVLGLSKRVHSRLHKSGIRTVGELMKVIDKGLKKIWRIGDVAYEEVVRQVRKAGIGP